MIIQKFNVEIVSETEKISDMIDVERLQDIIAFHLPSFGMQVIVKESKV